MSVQKNQWWNFLEFLASSRSDADNDNTDWQKVATDLNLPVQEVREFINFFALNDKPMSNQLDVCMGASCRANGNEMVWQRLEQINNGRTPQQRINVVSVLCLNECDKGPCSRDADRIFSGHNYNWLDRIEGQRL